MKKAKGSYVFDLDGNRYIDYVLSWGPMILGHTQPKVLQAVIDAAKKRNKFLERLLDRNVNLQNL